MTYNPQFDDEFECSYFMLASIFVERRKYDLAREVLRRHCLTDEKLGASKACEMMGLVCEKEKLFKDAIFYYGRSWEIEKDLLNLNDDHGASSVLILIGSKLASCHMSCQNYIDAMEISDFISNKFPECGQFKEEIVNRCISSIRP